MKILILTNHSFMLWQFRRELICELRKDHTVVIGTPFGAHIADFEGMGCHMIDTKLDRRGIDPVQDLGLYRRYCALLRKEQPDLVITYSIKPNIYGGYACRRMGIPYCVNVQGLGTAFQKPALSRLVTWLYRMALKNAKVVFFENSGNAAEFCRRGITPPAQQCLLPGAGVDLTHFAYCPYPDHETPHFLYLGRIMREKGVEELFAAAERLHREGENFVLDMVGFFEDIDKSRVDALVAEGIAVFHGFQADPIPYYRAADCVVLPSYHEGMSNVLLEAAAIGRPVITSDIPGCREAVEDGKTGYLCRVKDAASVYGAMKKFLSETVAVRADMGRQGRLRMEMIFEKKNVVCRTLAAMGLAAENVDGRNIDKL